MSEKTAAVESFLQKIAAPLIVVGIPALMFGMVDVSMRVVRVETTLQERAADHNALIEVIKDVAILKHDNERSEK